MEITQIRKYKKVKDWSLWYFRVKIKSNFYLFLSTDKLYEDIHLIIYHIHLGLRHIHLGLQHFHLSFNIGNQLSFHYVEVALNICYQIRSEICVICNWWSFPFVVCWWTRIIILIFFIIFSCNFIVFFW